MIPQHPNPRAWFDGTRKGLLFKFVIATVAFAVVAVVIPISVLMASGRLDYKVGTAFVMGTVMTGAWLALKAGVGAMNAIALEDSAEKQGPQNVAATGNVTIGEHEAAAPTKPPAPSQADTPVDRPGRAEVPRP